MSENIFFKNQGPFSFSKVINQISINNKYDLNSNEIIKNLACIQKKLILKSITQEMR